MSLPTRSLAVLFLDFYDGTKAGWAQNSTATREGRPKESDLSYTVLSASLKSSSPCAWAICETGERACSASSAYIEVLVDTSKKHKWADLPPLALAVLDGIMKMCC